MKKLDSNSMVFLCLVMLMAGSGALPAQTFPPNFSQVSVANGISSPTVMAFAPDGRVFVAQQNGALIVIKNGVKLATPAIQLTVNSSGESILSNISAYKPEVVLMYGKA